jgi:predicted ATP-grasp superfamily ATP-dependent carboligase
MDHTRLVAEPLFAKPDWPPVVVAGAYLTGVVLMRDLRRRGLKACAIDSNPAQPGFRSVYGKTWLCPNPEDDPNAWVDFMIGLSQKLGGKPVLIPSADQFVLAIADCADRLDPYFVFCRSGIATQALLATKRKQYDIAGSHGLPVPGTAVISSVEDAAEFAKKAQFPCLLKPIHFREWQRLPAEHPLHGEKLVIGNTPDDFLEKYRLAATVSPEIVAQEIIQGPDTAKLVYLSCYAQNGERLAGLVFRQVRTAPMDFGSASIVEPVFDPEADSLSDAFLRSIGYTGLCELELKRDTRDGKVKLIEANPRYTVTSDAAVYAGVELGWLHYLDLTGKPVSAAVARSRPFRHVVLARDFACFRSYVKAGLLTRGEWMRSYLPPARFFDFDLRDWRVTLDTVVGLAKTFFYPYYRRIFPKSG